MARSFRISGFRELDQALAELPKSLERNVLRRVATKALQPFVERAKSLAPVDEGNLRDSIVIAGSGLSRGAKAVDRAEPKQGVRMYAGTANRNAVPREFGSIRAPAHPFMRPAWDATSEGMLKSVAADLGPEIERTAARAAKRKATSS